MKIAVTHGDALRQEVPLLILTVWEDEALPESVAQLVEAGDWQAGAQQALLLYPRGALPARRLLLIGMGKRGGSAVEQLREAAALAAQRARELKIDRPSFAVPTIAGTAPALIAQTIVEGIQLGLYRFLRYKTGLKDQDRYEIGEVTLIAAEPNEAIQQGVATGESIARGVALARDLSNAPGNEITPSALAEAARTLAEQFDLRLTVLGMEELLEQGFGGVIGVGKGSEQPPRFIVVEYGAQHTGAPTICIVGKGVTFDTGGISIKSAERMDDMKRDMSGAAAVLGTIHTVAELKLPLHVVGLISAVENMPSGSAYKPGDILTTLSGKTIEVLNTDAEGRIVLADGLFYAQRYQPDAIIDLATLTGGVTVALGPHATGMFSNNDGLAARLTTAGEATGERVWRMPLWDAYMEMVKSSIADIKNSAGRQASPITAAAFLANFVGDYPWAHLDIAGTAWTETNSRASAPKGSTGVGVRLLVQALRTWSEQG